MNQLGGVRAAELVVLLSAAISGHPSYSQAFWKAQGLALVKFLFKRDAGIYVKQLVDDMVPAVAEGVAATTAFPRRA